MFEISALRLAGIAAGLAAVFMGFRRLRADSGERGSDILMIITGGLALSVSLFPQLANIPSDLFHMKQTQGGRLITLLILSTAALWFLFMDERAKNERLRIQFDNLVRVVAKESYSPAPGAPSLEGGTLILMPAMDEEENLRKVIPRIPTTIAGAPAMTLVIDDGSRDDTWGAAKESGAMAVRNPFNRGGGAALRLGYDVAAILRPKVLVTMDADGQHQPEEIERLVAPIMEDRADIIVGSRVLGTREKDSVVRWAGVHVFNWIINALMGTNITDCSSGFRAFRLEAIGKLTLVQEQYHTAELIIVAAKAGLRIQEEPIHISRRISGESKKGKNLVYGFRFLRTVIKSWIR
ncbi:MAG: glycosyltransferase family 2 protein [Nitrospinota bacterium]|nr:glycosyltransferase family 2 protein [Nitrospinota bacterium]